MNTHRIPSTMHTHLLVALECEAEPLIAHYDLQRVTDAEPFRLYEGDRVTLVVSGVGKVAAASAAAYSFAFRGGRRNSAWLNVGLGGHAEHSVGERFLAHKITDHATGRSWYPPQVFKPPCRTAPLLTVDRPERAYEGPFVHDMEAAGFYATACRFATAELVHSYKIVSDNRECSVDDVSPQLATRLIEASVDEIDLLVGHLTELTSELAALEAEPRDFQRIVDLWRFTVTEKRQLRRLLLALDVRAAGESPWDAGFESLGRAKDVLNYLAKLVRNLPVKFH